MKVLFATPFDPYAQDGGGALRVRAFIEAAAGKYEAHLLCLASKRRVEAPASGPLRRVEAIAFARRGAILRLVRSVLLRTPDLALRTRSHRGALALHRGLIHEQYGAVHLAGLQMAYLQEPFWTTVLTSDGRLPAGGCRPALILDELNAEYAVHGGLARAFATRGDLLRAAHSALQQWLLRAYERAAILRSDIVTCPSEADRRRLVALGSSRPIRVVPSGVDTGRYLDLPPPVDQHSVLMVADFSYRPNLQGAEWLAGAIAPAVWARVPDAEFVLVGGGRTPNPPKELPGRFRSVGYAGDVLPYLAASKVVVAPLLAGGGVKLKVLEGMAAGRPVVATSVGAEGIGAENAREIVVEDAPERFAAALVDLLLDTDLARRIGAAARKRAEGFDSAIAGRSYLAVLEEAVAGVQA